MLEKLSILKDEPLLTDGKGFDRNEDAFNHQAYAEAVSKIIEENPPPLSVGLFGPWGIGKSTVVNILFHLIKQAEDAKLKPIYFNAWKYSDDSFRRQFLIEVANQVYAGSKDQEAKVRRLEQLNYTSVLRGEEDKNLLDRLKEVVRSPLKLKEQGVLRLVLAGVIVVVGGGVAYGIASPNAFFLSLTIALLVSLLGKPEEIFVLQKPPVHDPQLIFPEQFEAEFRNLVSTDGPLDGKKAVIAIDDIDRCEPDTIRDILISIKTFLGQENCYFIVPCDDKSVVRVFDDPNQKEGYKDEMLRKYFNLGVRMAPLMATDLLDFANATSRKTSIPPKIVQMAVLANCHDARKMKHFLNTFVAKYAVAKSRREKGLMPVNIDDNLAAFAKVVLLEDLYPALFERMVEHPEIYATLEKAVSGVKVESELKTLELSNWEKDFPNLREILRRTSDVKIEHIELFVSLKTTNPESRIPRGFELRNAILKGDTEVVDDIAKQISDDDARRNLADLLTDLLQRASETFLRNAISAALQLYHREGALAEADKTRVAQAVSFDPFRRPDQKVLPHAAEQVLSCAKAAGGTYLEASIRKYEQEISSSDAPPARLAETINALYQYASDRKSIATVFNTKLDNWIAKEEPIIALADLQPPSDLAADERIPSLVVVQKVVASMETDASENTTKMNELRKAVAFKYWEDSLAPSMAERLFQILQQSAPSEPAESVRNAFVFKALIQNPKCLEAKFSPQIWPLVEQVHNRTTEWKHKLEAHKVVVLFAALSPDASVKQTAHQFAVQSWQSLGYEELNDVLGFINTLDDPGKLALKDALLKQERTLAENEIQSPSERTKRRIKLFHEHTGVDGESAIKQLLLRTLETPDAAFGSWTPSVIEYAAILQPSFASEATEKILNLVVGSVSQQKRQGLLNLFTTLMGKVEPDGKVNLLQRFFELCKHTDANIRNAAVAIIPSVKGSVEEADFRRALDALARDLFNIKSTADVPAYWPAIDVVMDEQVYFEDYTWRDLGDLSKRLMEQADLNLKKYGLSLVEQMSGLPKAHEEDLIQQLVNTARGGDTAHKERAAKVLERIDISSLQSGAKKVLKEYRKSIEEKDGKD